MATGGESEKSEGSLRACANVSEEGRSRINYQSLCITFSIISLCLWAQMQFSALKFGTPIDFTLNFKPDCFLLAVQLVM